MKDLMFHMTAMGKGKFVQHDILLGIMLTILQAVDAVYINGGNSEGFFMVAATARRQNNVVQTVLYLRVRLCKVY